MPLYPYRCYACNNNFEVFRPMSEAGANEVCPHCGGIGTRVFTPTAFSFGWRLTERAHQKGGPREEKERDV